MTELTEPYIKTLGLPTLHPKPIQVTVYPSCKEGVRPIYRAKVLELARTARKLMRKEEATK